MTREKRTKEGQEAELALAQETSEIRVDPIALIKTLMKSREGMIVPGKKLEGKGKQIEGLTI